MARSTPLLAVLLLLTASARSEATSSDCLAFAKKSCYYVPPGAAEDAPLLVYLRGHWGKYKAAVPSEIYLTSARQAFTHYELGETAKAKGVILLVTYRSGVVVTEKDVVALAVEAKRTFSHVYLAAHSGGCVGLKGTLDSLAASRVIMLDNFYGGSGAGLAPKVQKLISSGAACRGFYTPHNKDDYDDGYKKGIKCTVDYFNDDDEHTYAVRRCLGKYLDGLSCK